MTWEAHQGLGFFGFDAPAKKGAAEQPRHMKVLDVEEALERSAHALALWLEARKHPDSPPFSGGVLDCWPGWAVDALAICRSIDSGSGSGME